MSQDLAVISSTYGPPESTTYTTGTATPIEVITKPRPRRRRQTREDTEEEGVERRRA